MKKLVVCFLMFLVVPALAFSSFTWGVFACQLPYFNDEYEQCSINLVAESPNFVYGLTAYHVLAADLSETDLNCKYEIIDHFSSADVDLSLLQIDKRELKGKYSLFKVNTTHLNYWDELYFKGRSQKYWGYPKRFGHVWEQPLDMWDTPFYKENYFKTTFSVWYGDSGSAVLNNKGELVGILVRLQFNDYNSGIVVSPEEIKEFLAAAFAYYESKPVTVQRVTEEDIFGSLMPTKRPKQIKD